MRGPRGVFLGFVVLSLAPLPVFALTPIDEMIAALNELLADHSFIDHSGQQAKTSIAIEEGVLVVQTAKHKGADVFTNIWRAPVGELDADDIRVERVPGHTEVVIRSRASVMMELRATTGGMTNEWALPAAHAVVVQFESNPETALEVRDRMSELIHAAKVLLKVVS